MTSTIQENEEPWTLVIRSQRGLFDLRLKELWRARELIMLFVWRDFVSANKQTILGPFWYILQPILSALIFTVVFGEIARLPTDGVPPFLFYLSGQTVWSFFSACLMSTSNIFVGNAGLFGKIYFHRLSVPIAAVISNLISFSIRFGLFIVFLVYFILSGVEVHVTLWALFLPVLLLIMAGLGMGFGIIISSLTTKYRDLQRLLGIGVQLLTYVTPILYPLTIVPEKWRFLILANPMTPVVEAFRLGFLGAGSIGTEYMFYSTGFMLVAFFIGLLIFNRAENTFIDTV
ncbi:MAG: ABC transporter permease [Chloroflexota bacterium]